jgi:hypothetical protein
MRRDKTNKKLHIPQGRRFDDFPAQKNQMYDQQPFQQVPSAQCRFKHTA